MTLPADILRRSPTLPIMVEQEIDLSKHDQFLHLGVWVTLTAAPAIDTPLEFSEPAMTQNWTCHRGCPKD